MTPANDGELERREQDRKASRVLVVCAASAAIVVLLASLIQGPPGKLPDVALGWPLILYLERAGVVALLIMGAGLGYNLWQGDKVKQVGAGPANLGTEEATKPTEALKEGVDADVRDLSERLTEVERKTEHLNAAEP